MTRERFRQTAGRPPGGGLFGRLLVVAIWLMTAGVFFAAGLLVGEAGIDRVVAVFTGHEPARVTVSADLPARPPIGSPAAPGPAPQPATVTRHTVVEPVEPPEWQADDYDRPAWQRFAVETADPAGRPMIAIVIDDLGLNPTLTRKAIALPPPVTLSFLPYSEMLDPLTVEARAAGHELLLHIPMQPISAAHDPGPNALLVDLPPDEIDRRLQWALGRFDEYVGVNNHMGSLFTGTRSVMTPVLQTLTDRGLLFLDSRTTVQSVAPELAAELGLPFARNDVFLDHDPAPDAVRRALSVTEQLAERRGAVIAIGHPNDATLDALAEWLPRLVERGFLAVPVSAIVGAAWQAPEAQGDAPVAVGLSPSPA